MDAHRGRSNSTIAELEPVGPRGELASQLYERFGKNLEPDHAGRFVAITADGRSVIGDTLLETTRQAVGAFGPGSFIFKVGEGVVGTWR